jgi:hypothetical protein
MRTLITFITLWYCTFAKAAEHKRKLGDGSAGHGLKLSEGEMLQPQLESSSPSAIQELIATISAFAVRLFEALIVFSSALIDAVVIFLGAVVNALIVFLVAL